MGIKVNIKPYKKRDLALFLCADGIKPWRNVVGDIHWVLTILYYLNFEINFKNCCTTFNLFDKYGPVKVLNNIKLSMMLTKIQNGH